MNDYVQVPIKKETQIRLKAMKGAESYTNYLDKLMRSGSKNWVDCSSKETLTFVSKGMTDSPVCFVRNHLAETISENISRITEMTTEGRTWH